MDGGIMGICRKRQSTIQAAGLLMFQSSRSSLSGRQRLEQSRGMASICDQGGRGVYSGAKEPVSRGGRACLSFASSGSSTSGRPKSGKSQ
uniref:Uncharacterized protein n=1 Tax=Bionectria ochroleuca TaxID=29856 RepID=A0A0B7K2G7_BIOOC